MWYNCWHNMQETSIDPCRRAALRRENIFRVCVVAILMILVCAFVGNCYRGIRFFEEVAARAMKCSSVEELRKAIPDECRHEQVFVKDGRKFLRISVHIRPPKFATYPLAFKAPAFIFDDQGRKIDQCLYEYDAGEFRQRWIESYPVSPRGGENTSKERTLRNE